MYVGETHPDLFIECFAGAAGTTLTLVLNKRAHVAGRAGSPLSRGDGTGLSYVAESPKEKVEL